jgi:HAE1 family hydrophobic/amphiphilic exporter-1
MTFAPGTDPDWPVQVQNKLQLPWPACHRGATQGQVTSPRKYLIIVGLISEDGSMNMNDLMDYAHQISKKCWLGAGVVKWKSSARITPWRWLNPNKLLD